MSIDLPYTEAKRVLNEEFERLYVKEMLARHEGNVTRAAAAAGLPRKSFARVMSRHRLGRPGRPRNDGARD